MLLCCSIPFVSVLWDEDEARKQLFLELWVRMSNVWRERVRTAAAVRVGKSNESHKEQSNK
jgi:hypothetical protein